MEPDQFNNDIIDRPAVVSGRFYPGNREELNAELTEHFKEAGKLAGNEMNINDEVLAVISPHAGYVYSGLVSASAFILLRNTTDIRRIFILGSSHHISFNGASVYYRGDYITPLGKVKVDRETALELLKHPEVFQFVPEAHSPEHCIEVQLPFIQYIFSDTITIVPVLIGTQDEKKCKEAADILKPYMGESGNLFVISTDLSHYPEYNDAHKIDRLTVNAILKNDPAVFIEEIRNNESRGIGHLATSICGWTSVLTLLYITSKMNNLDYKPVLYKNSGDTPIYGDKSRVVGYQSLIVTRNNKK